ncbi:MAG: hypothetical protein HY422_01790 [Candidatus Komeilibacteria bacterium]|nr:hypothetical protein [Candidatus Komeilibacteria bacterium]
MKDLSKSHYSPMISNERLEEFRRIYKEAYEEEITIEEAREMARRFLVLHRLLRKPLPGDPSSHPTVQQPPAHTSGEVS